MAAFRKGGLQYLILQALAEKPMHGYDIIRSLSEEFGGFYQPSAGAIYPTLQTLEDQEYVKGEEKEGKRTYSITEKGKEHLKESVEKYKAMIEKRKALFGERRSLNRELRNLASLVMTNYRDLTPEKADRIAQILKEARRKIDDIISE